MKTLVIVLVIVLGASIGSFLSAVIYRIKNKKKFVMARSICPGCKKKIKARHLVPIISWLILKGKCAYCNKKISPHYFFLELITASIFLALFFKWNFIDASISSVSPEILNYQFNWHLFSIFSFYVVEFTFLIGIFFYDLLYKEIPDGFSLPAIVIAIIGGLYFQFVSPISMLLGGSSILLFFLLQFLISKGAWIGGGDLRLGLLMGILLGLEQGLLALISGYTVGAIFSIYLLANAKVNRKTQIPFGPFLVIGIVISLFYGMEIMDFYFNQILI